MLGVYTTDPHQMLAHVAKADMLLFEDDFNKKCFLSTAGLRRLSSAVEHYITEGFTNYSLSIIINFLLFLVFA
jgi:hypothetical protein